MHFTSKKVKQALTRPIVAKWINAFEAIIGQHGHLYPVHEEPISLHQLASLCQTVRNKLSLPALEQSVEPQPKIARKQAFRFSFITSLNCGNYLQLPFLFATFSKTMHIIKMPLCYVHWTSSAASTARVILTQIAPSIFLKRQKS